MTAPRIHSSQRGATLFVSLIMLLLITLLAAASFTLGKGSLQIVGNMQQRAQTFSAAQAAVAAVISTTQFTSTPGNAVPLQNVPGYCYTGSATPAANATCSDVNGSGNPDIAVQVAPTCDSIQPIPVTQLDYSNPNDAGCLVGASQDFGVVGASNNNSMCASSVWDVQATATDNVTGAQYVVDQGVAVRVPSSTVCP